MTEVKSSKIICKGNLTGNFELVPMELFDYLELGLISRNAFVVFVRLLKHYNPDYGYAFPTIAQLRLSTGIGGKGTIDKALDNLENVGLIKRFRGKGRDNNLYLVYKPLEQQELYETVPDKVQELLKRKEDNLTAAEHEKERLLSHRNAEEKEEQEISAPTILPKVDYVQSKHSKWNSAELDRIKQKFPELDINHLNDKEIKGLLSLIK